MDYEFGEAIIVIFAVTVAVCFVGGIIVASLIVG